MGGEATQELVIDVGLVVVHPVRVPVVRVLRARDEVTATEEPSG
jgi:hypothetical protein